MYIFNGTWDAECYALQEKGTNHLARIITKKLEADSYHYLPTTWIRTWNFYINCYIVLEESGKD